jgi:hypothetical protein
LAFLTVLNAAHKLSGLENRPLSFWQDGLFPLKTVFTLNSLRGQARLNPGEDAPSARSFI